MRNRKPTNELFQLSANGGIPRERVLEMLQNPRVIARLAQVGRCFLCRASDIDATALCLVCRSFLNDEERAAAQKYYE